MNTMNRRTLDFDFQSGNSERVEYLAEPPIQTHQLSTVRSLGAVDILARVPKYRSDLAFASGFAGLACLLFRFSLIPLIFDLGRSGVLPVVFFFLALPLPGLPAPLALWLGIKAWSDLKRHPGKSGWVPTVVGLIIGLLGTLILLSETYQVVKALFVLDLQ